MFLTAGLSSYAEMKHHKLSNDFFLLEAPLVILPLLSSRSPTRRVWLLFFRIVPSHHPITWKLSMPRCISSQPFPCSCHCNKSNLSTEACRCSPWRPQGKSSTQKCQKGRGWWDMSILPRKRWIRISVLRQDFYLDIASSIFILIWTCVGWVGTTQKISRSAKV